MPIPDSPHPARVIRLDAARRIYGDRVDRILTYLWKSDEDADAAVAALGPRGLGMALAALDGQDVPVPPAVQRIIDHAHDVPPWVDWPTIDAAGRVLLRSGALGGLVLACKALPYAYASAGGNKPLVLSGRLTDMAPRRLAETARFIEAVVAPGGARVGGAGFRIAVKVRLVHAAVRRHLLESGRWRSDLWGLPINQHDMAGTSLLFSIVLIEGLQQLGCEIAPEEADAYVHLWRWMGHIMGIVPELQVANARDARRHGEIIDITSTEPDDDSRALVRALLESTANSPTLAVRKRAAWLRPLLDALVRELVGAPLADKLGVRPGKADLAMPAIRTAMKGLELLRQRSRRVEDGLVSFGAEYWARAVHEGMGGAPVDFGAVVPRSA